MMVNEKENMINNRSNETSLRPIENESLPSINKRSEVPYSNVLQGKGIHGLFSSSTSHGDIQINAVTRTGTFQSDGVLITIDEEAIQEISPQTFKVLLVFLTAVTAQIPRIENVPAEAINKGRVVQISLSEYMKACRIKDRKVARDQLNDAIKTLYAVSLEWDEQSFEKPEGKKRSVKVTNHHRMRITDHTITEDEGNPVKRGVATFKFSFDMAEYLSNSYIMPYPASLLSINTQYHPYSFSLGWKLCSLYNMNYGKDRQNYTTVKTLIEAIKDLPRYEDIVKTGNIYNRIIKPFDRDMNELVKAGVLSCYWYYQPNGKKILSNQISSLCYADFIKLYVHYEMKDYPDRSLRLEAQSKRLTGAISRNRKEKKKSNNDDTLL